MPLLSPEGISKLYKKVALLKPRLLGLDVGTMNVGVSLSDPTLSMAVPLTTLFRSDCITPIPDNKLFKLVKENKVFAIVVGFPAMINDEETVQCEDVKLFIHQFTKAVQMNMPMVFNNESYTTQMAMANYANRGRREWNRGLKKKDELAAAIILQDYLDCYNPAKTDWL